MKRAVLLLLGMLLLALPAASSAAEFGLEGLEVRSLAADGSPQVQAGSHPFSLVTNLEAVTEEVPPGSGIQRPIAEAKDVDVSFPAGFVGDPTAVPRCTTAQFLAGETGECPNGSVLGVAEITYSSRSAESNTLTSPVYSLTPSPGEVAKLGFIVFKVAPVVVDVTVSQSPPYNVRATTANVSQSVFLRRANITIWGVPTAPSHDALRGTCLGEHGESLGNCPVSLAERPFLTLPTDCSEPLSFGFAADSWQHPTPPPYPFQGTATVSDESTPPNPLTPSGCAKLEFSPTIAAKPTSRAASSPSGLDFSLAVDDEGLRNPAEGAAAASTIEKTVVTLPEGFTINPSIAEGLEVCSEAQLAAETAFSAPGAGCPDGAKIGTVAVESPLIEQPLQGALYQAVPYENPFGSLIALYVVIKSPELGIKIVQPLRVDADPATGQLTTVAEDMPQLPFSQFRLHFREGARSPLATPSTCGTYEVSAMLYPHSGQAPVKTTSAFQILTGPNEGPCPSGGLPLFKPRLTAGTLNNAGGAFSPFNLRLSRSDSEQEITHFSIKLPPGTAAKLAGIPLCTDAQIAQASARTGPHGGAEELADPSCPAASQVGRSLAGSGVGPALAYAPGKIYLAGPYHGSPISLVAITSGVVGPFDIGTVLVRLAVDVNPETGEVFLDSTGSDPIPHIVKGIQLHLRDIRAYTDRPRFTYNPTSCERTSTAATVLGSGLDLVSPADDNPFVSTAPFQAADCAALPFKPKLTLKLKGSTKRSGNPALSAHLAMAGMGATGANESGLAYSRVALPKTLFLDNAHIGTVCTRVQFKAGAVEGEKCPARSIIGSARATTPILDAPLAGPIYLRSNPERELPDIAASLLGSEISVVAVGHIDSAKSGGLRTTFEVIPDAPISSVDIDLFGGKRGLLVISRNLCSYQPRAQAEFKGHNGRVRNYPKLKIRATGCKHKHKKKGKKEAHAGD